MNRMTLVLALALSLAMAGCSQPDVALGRGGGATTQPAEPAQPRAEPPAGDPYLTGKVVTVKRDGAAHTVGSIHLRAEAPGAGGESEIVATVGTTTPFVRKTSGGRYEPVRFADITKGDTVSVWVGGEVMESFPVQAGADFLVLQE